MSTHFPRLAYGLVCLAVMLGMPTGAVLGQRISGLVLDEMQEPLPGVNVLVPALGQGTITHEGGRFMLDALPADTLEVQFSFIGYQTETRRVNLTAGNATLTVMLKPDIVEIASVEVTATRDPAAELGLGTQSVAVLTTRELDEHRGQTLGETLEGVPGVTVLQTGPSIAKPVIRGLHSQRIVVLNAGIPQEGQQWGAEHAPEIDPFAAGRIEVLKGAAGVEYGAGAMGGVIRVEPSPLPGKPGVMGGKLSLNGFSNNRQGAGSLLVEGGGPGLMGLGWRLQGSYRKAGDARAPGYVIGNSGFEELNGSVSAGISRPRMGLEAYVSHFGTELGIYRGAHIGNADDLLRAFEHGRPLADYTFGYAILPPKQLIRHDLATLRGYYRTLGGDRFEAQYGVQRNNRQEFDAHRPYSDSLVATDQPAFALTLTTHSLDLKYKHRPLGNLFGKIGLAGMRQGNVNDRTGFLIPNFYAYSGGLYALETWIENAWTVEAGGRVDYRKVKAWPRENRTYVARETDYGSASGVIGVNYQFARLWSVGANLGTAWRAPSVNELYNLGVHHGTAQYEIGNPTLTGERSLNADVTVRHLSGRGRAELSLYNNRIGGFIYLFPLPEPTVTIRGTFPTFRYEQADAVLRGFDGLVEHRLTSFLGLGASASVVRGINLETREPLINMPADRIGLSGHFDFPERPGFRNGYVEVSTKLVRAQDRVPDSADRFIIRGDTVRIRPPAGYALLDLDFGAELRVGRVPINVHLSVQNVLDAAYRDYLSRFRYFIDEPGRSIVLRLQIPFGQIEQD